VNPFEQIAAQTPDDRLDNGRARTASVDVRDRGLSVGHATAQCALQRKAHRQGQSLVPQIRSELPDSPPDLPLVAAIEGRGDKPEARVADPDRVDIEVEIGGEGFCTDAIEHVPSQPGKSAPLRVDFAPRITLRHKRYAEAMNETPGRLLRETRRHHGLTQTQLAARARTSQAAISRIERDLVSPSVAMLARLLDLMGEDLVLDAEPIDYGHDRTLIRQNLARTADERLDHGTSFANFVLRNRGVARAS
jgi:transcriptional regulator with XRE-family HTH domain